MAIVLSPSWLWWFGQCPYKRVNSKYEADPRNTAHWNLMNAAANAAISGTDNKLWPRIRYYDNNINFWLEKRKQISSEILKEWMWKIYKFFKQYITPDYQIRQEQKFEYPVDLWDDDIRISWQPDVIVIHNNQDKEDWIVATVIDIKCWKISRYDNPEIWRENSQRFIYPRFVFNHWWMEINQLMIDKPKIKFSFLVVDKWSWDMKEFSKILDEYTVNIQIKEHVKQFRELQKQELDKKDYPAKKCRWCMFCEFSDTCPLKKDEISVSNDELNELF